MRSGACSLTALSSRQLALIGRRGREGGWRTPLHAATDWPGYFPAVPATAALLLEAGADPNDDTGGDRPETPLHWAASTDDVDVAIVLVDNGADLETPGGSIGTPLDNAIGYGCWNVARLLVARGARVDKLWHAAALGMLERTEQLLDEHSETADDVSHAFWHACAVGQRRAAEYLLTRAPTSTGYPNMPKAPRSTQPPPPALVRTSHQLAARPRCHLNQGPRLGSL